MMTAATVTADLFNAAALLPKGTLMRLRVTMTDDDNGRDRTAVPGMLAFVADVDEDNTDTPYSIVAENGCWNFWTREEVARDMDVLPVVLTAEQVQALRPSDAFVEGRLDALLEGTGCTAFFDMDGSLGCEQEGEHAEFSDLPERVQVIIRHVLDNPYSCRPVEGETEPARPATDEEIREARNYCGDNDIVFVEDGAMVRREEGGCLEIQAWVRID